MEIIQGPNDFVLVCNKCSNILINTLKLNIWLYDAHMDNGRHFLRKPSPQECKSLDNEDVVYLSLQQEIFFPLLIKNQLQVLTEQKKLEDQLLCSCSYPIGHLRKSDQVKCACQKHFLPEIELHLDKLTIIDVDNLWPLPANFGGPPYSVQCYDQNIIKPTKY